MPIVAHALILAAGEGRRLGTPKVSLSVAGKWLLPQLVLTFKAAGVRKVTLVVSEDSKHLINKLGSSHADSLMVNPNPKDGKMSSILCGLDQIPKGEPAWIHPCDTPLIKPESLIHIQKQWSKQPERQKFLARPVSSAQKGGHPLLAGSERIKELKGFTLKDSLRKLLQDNLEYLLDVKIPEDPGLFLNINTKEQIKLVEDLLT